MHIVNTAGILQALQSQLVITYYNIFSEEVRAIKWILID